MIRKGDIVCLVDGEHTDLLFRADDHCLRYDGDQEAFGLCIIVEPIDPVAFMLAFGVKDVEPSDIQLVVRLNEVVKVAVKAGCVGLDIESLVG